MAPADRTVIKAAGVEAAKFTRGYNDKSVVIGIDQLKAAGMTIVSDVDKAAFQTAMEGLNDRLASVAGGLETIASVRSMLA